MNTSTRVLAFFLSSLLLLPSCTSSSASYESLTTDGGLGFDVADDGAGVHYGPETWWELGDSITYGQGTTPIEGYRRLLWQWAESERCQVHFAGTLQAGSWPGAFHDGHSGYGIDGLSSVVKLRYGTAIPHADLVLLLVGTNDMGQNPKLPYDSIGTSAKYAALLDQLAAVDPNTTMLVSTLPPIDPTKYPVPAENVRDFNSRLPAIWDTFDHAHSTPLIRADVFARLAPWGSVRFFDVWHPNPTGYALIANEQELVIRERGLCR